MEPARVTGPGVAPNAALTPGERALIKRHFSVCLCNLADFEAYWVPSKRKIAARSPGAAKVHPRPADAVLIGAYSHPFPMRDFMFDLDDLLARLAEAELVRGLEHAAARLPESAPSTATGRPVPETTWTWSPARFNLSLQADPRGVGTSSALKSLNAGKYRAGKLPRWTRY